MKLYSWMPSCMLLKYLSFVKMKDQQSFETPGTICLPVLHPKRLHFSAVPCSWFLSFMGIFFSVKSEISIYNVILGLWTRIHYLHFLLSLVSYGCLFPPTPSVSYGVVISRVWWWWWWWWYEIYIPCGMSNALPTLTPSSFQNIFWNSVFFNTVPYKKLINVELMQFV